MNDKCNDLSVDTVAVDTKGPFEAVCLVWKYLCKLWA